MIECRPKAPQTRCVGKDEFALVDETRFFSSLDEPEELAPRVMLINDILRRRKSSRMHERDLWPHDRSNLIKLN
jgi:hypothetical protein